MKILLLGDFSGVGANLAPALVRAGYEVTIAASPDWRSFGSDIVLAHSKQGWKRILYDRLHPIKLLKSLTGYDVVQFVDPYGFFVNYFPRKWYYRNLIEGNGKSFLLAASMDGMFWRHASSYMRYTPEAPMKKYDWNDHWEWKTTERAYQFNRWLADQVDGIISVAYDYTCAYDINYGHKLHTLPLPIDVASISFQPLKAQGSVLFYHGRGQYGFKGTCLIDDVFNRLVETGRDGVVYSTARKMPIKEYIEKLKNVHVVVDQVNSYSYGMNALYSLATGKLVMSGAEPEALRILGVEECPVFNVRPEREHIERVVEDILSDKYLIESISYIGREYVSRYHSADRVAMLYLDTWGLLHE